MLIAKVPRYIREGDLLLRPLRIWDGPFLGRMLNRGDILAACGLSRPFETSWFSLYRRLKAIFPLVYRIEYASDTIGFIGLYNLRTDKTAEMSLMIFEASRRRTGFGTAAFRLLSSVLEKNRLVKKWVVSVRRDNAPASAFWTKLGFEEVWQDAEIIKMALSAGMKRPDRTFPDCPTATEKISLKGTA
jgi:ribosomal protein S18 acetylase RimI-like enzyme